MDGSELESESREATLRDRWDRGVASDEELIELALLMPEPQSEDDEVLDALNDVVANGGLESLRSLARVWINYFRLLSVLGEESRWLAFDDSFALCYEETGPHAAASCMLAALALEFDVARSEQKLELLRRSIALEPTWVLNRANLAYHHGVMGDAEAEQLAMSLARANYETPDPSAGIVEVSFKKFISGVLE